MGYIASNASITKCGIRRAARSRVKGAVMDQRVKFDFEIDFSNGGGIQGQDFRLDIAGDDISNEELTDYIVDDMRLLMVKEVRILNKQIINEKHKRQPTGKKQFLYYLKPARLGMVTEGSTPEEAEVVSRHFEYLKDLTEKGVMIRWDAHRTTTNPRLGLPSSKRKTN